MRFYTLNQIDVYNGIRVVRHAQSESTKPGCGILLGKDAPAPNGADYPCVRKFVPLADNVPAIFRTVHTLRPMTIQVMDEGDALRLSKNKFLIGPAVPEDKRAMIRSYCGPVNERPWTPWGLKTYFGEQKLTFIHGVGYSPDLDGKMVQWTDSLEIVPPSAAIVAVPKMAGYPARVLYNTGSRLWVTDINGFKDFVRLWVKMATPERRKEEKELAEKRRNVELAELL